ncbi:MAG: threonine ammonia-lyase [Candidatus Hermodarchaeia archaeon]
MSMVSFEDVTTAYERIREAVIQTPVMTSLTANRLTNCSIFFKCENFQRIGAFKFRGAYNAISQLSSKERKRGVIAHSSGNHAQAVALAAKMIGIPSTIVMPKNSSPVKIVATKGYGANVVFCEPTVDGREKMVTALMEKHQSVLIHPYDDPRVIAGAGTAALELFNEVGALDSILAPVGGGGLISGTTIASKGFMPTTRVFAVEPEQANDAYKSFTTGKLVPSINLIRKGVEEIITVSEEEIIEAMQFLWERMKLVVEPSGAVPLAGLFNSKDTFTNQHVGLILSGGNVDLTQFFVHFQKQSLGTEF